MSKLVLLLCLFCLCVASPAIASEERDSAGIEDASPIDPLAVAEMHLQKKEYGPALKRYEEAAAAGNPFAQNRIGELYRDGLGVNQNYQTAASWFSKAAAKKFPPAQVNLGFMYEKGLGFEQDYGHARGLYLLAVRQNDALAKFRMGYLIENGLGTEKNMKFAIGWYRQAADAGNVDAMLTLASLCINGEEKPNYNGARVWYLRAANLGSAEAEKMLGYLYERGLGIQQDIAEAVKWYKSAAAKGNKEAAERVRAISISGPKALMDAASKGDVDAMFNLAVSYDNGTGVTVDYVKAVEWYLEAARKRADTDEVYELESRRKLYTDDFAGLEDTARELRQKQTKSHTGNWQLATFYDVVSKPMYKNRGNNQHWSYLLDKLQKWNQAFPDSITARVALAQYYTESPLAPASASVTGTQDSGHGRVGDSVAEKILKDALTLPQRCPQWYAVMLKIGESEGWEETRLEALFYEAIKSEPTYLSYYATEVEHLAGKWQDRNVDWIPLAEKMEAVLGGHEGGVLFTEISWLALRQTRDAFKFMQSNLKIWDKIKQGFEYRERIYGRNNYDLSRLCYMAVFVQDKELSRKLFTMIGNDWSREVFPYQEVFDMHRKWAFE